MKSFEDLKQDVIDYVAEQREYSGVELEWHLPKPGLNASIDAMTTVEDVVRILHGLGFDFEAAYLFLTDDESDTFADKAACLLLDWFD